MHIVRLVEAAGGEAEIWYVTSSSLQGVVNLRKTGVRRQNQQWCFIFFLQFLSDGDGVDGLHIRIDCIDLSAAVSQLSSPKLFQERLS